MTSTATPSPVSFRKRGIPLQDSAGRVVMTKPGVAPVPVTLALLCHTSPCLRCGAGVNRSCAAGCSFGLGVPSSPLWTIWL